MIKKNLDISYDPKKFEKNIYFNWEKQDSFNFNNNIKKTYTIIMPPPNITGELHIGHVLNYTIQDILIRYYRMSGFNTFWQPGTDHAGIATQLLIERKLLLNNQSKYNLGRKKFLDVIWHWKNKYNNIILKQQKSLGLSANWKYQYFTMDDNINKAVIQVFINLYNEGLLYRDYRLVNWDPKIETAISDLEVVNIKKNNCLWYIKYPIVNNDKYISIATTRPETLFGDMAISIHPQDKRYNFLVGKYVNIPLTNRFIPIILDNLTDYSKGSGVVKITPAHDFHDFELGQRHKLNILNILDKNAFLNKNVPKNFKKLSRENTRIKIIEELNKQGLLDKIENINHMIPHGDRSDIILEPRLTKQWFVNTKKLSKAALYAVKKQDTKFIPKSWENTYFDWLNNIQPWCISRQIWWGHRIPAWYGPDNKIFVSYNQKEVQKQANKFYKKNVILIQDVDVLDTWFSSSILPFATLGWPSNKNNLDKYYPTSTIVTGFDIIFFWIARMMMMGLHFIKKVPFKDIYIHPLIKDKKGKKMSKTRGNVINPEEIINKYGADALRFALIYASNPTTNINFSLDNVKFQRNFATKIWNASIFCQQNNCNFKEINKISINKINHPINKWIIYLTQKFIKNITNHLKNYRFDLAAHDLYQFTKSSFCDWYLEFIKSIFQKGNVQSIKETKIVSPWVLASILKIIHPFMPFITEELWQNLFVKTKTDLLMLKSWPVNSVNITIDKDVFWLIDFIKTLRSHRRMINIPVITKLDLLIYSKNKLNIKRLMNYKYFIQRLSRIQSINVTKSIKNISSCIQIFHSDTTYLLLLNNIVNLNKEKNRLIISILKLQKEIKYLQIKLNNNAFLLKSPKVILETNKNYLVKYEKDKIKLENILLGFIKN